MITLIIYIYIYYIYIYIYCCPAVKFRNQNSCAKKHKHTNERIMMRGEGKESTIVIECPRYSLRMGVTVGSFE